MRLYLWQHHTESPPRLVRGEKMDGGIRYEEAVHGSPKGWLSGAELAQLVPIDNPAELARGLGHYLTAFGAMEPHQLLEVVLPHLQKQGFVLHLPDEDGIATAVQGQGKLAFWAATGRQATANDVATALGSAILTGATQGVLIAPLGVSSTGRAVLDQPDVNVSVWTGIEPILVSLQGELPALEGAQL